MAKRVWPRRLAIISLLWSLLNLAVWVFATIWVQTHHQLQNSIPYLAFVSNYALVGTSVAGIIAALAALFAEE